MGLLAMMSPVFALDGAIGMTRARSATPKSRRLVRRALSNGFGTHEFVKQQGL